MKLQYHHAGIVVSSLEKGKKQIEQIHGKINWSEKYYDPLQKVVVIFGENRFGLKVELLLPKGKKSPLTNVLREKKNILNHLAFTVKDISKCEKKFRKLGAMPLTSPLPAEAFNGALIQFFLMPFFVIYEIIEKK